jgi:beta-lactamase regulating signal transducer with metallopeptidase domain
LTDDITVSLDGRPESTPDTTTAPIGNRVSVSYVLRVIVIVLALLALFALISLTVIRFDRKQS